MPRAEVAGLVDLLTLAGPVGNLEVGIDNASVLRQLKSRQLARNSRSSDLWEMGAELLDNREGLVTGIKVKSHADDSNYAAGLTVSWAVRMKWPTYSPAKPLTDAKSARKRTLMCECGTTGLDSPYFVELQWWTDA